jgi:chlorite dismutase
MARSRETTRLHDDRVSLSRVSSLTVALPEPTQIARPIARVTFVAGGVGEWRVREMRAIRGQPLADAQGVTRIEAGSFASAESAAWVLRGVRSHERYLERAEKEALVSVQEDLGRQTSRLAVLIPIRKADAWWDLPQDERRAVFEARSHHIEIGSKYLPAIARRLYHCRELGEPFDFLTWFELREADQAAFDELLARLRETEEWRYVEREIEIRLGRG